MFVYSEFQVHIKKQQQCKDKMSWLKSLLNLCSSLLSKYMTKYKLIWFIVYEPESDQVSATYRKEIYFFCELSTSNNSTNNPNYMFVFCILQDVF